MGQQEVLLWLMEKREKGNLNFFSARQISEGIILEFGGGVNAVSRAVRQLAAYGQLDVRVSREKGHLTLKYRLGKEAFNKIKNK